ncbi:protein C1orf43 homolog isoform X2 [Etheostoma cragini]|uniref:protein C1orf43 homolog isoform X2 n=1 Tax=Etheostoma cragini TaxID=417921 RepID=UPI00155EC78F|nr:protein C1orf43 homolog isoform X2 [Etheostoma cragini]XP_034747051.1 protein C1orf43 homolog isoform X2 [Etheostoma cragini]
MAESLSGVNVVLVMAYGSLVFVLLFIFVKRQIMRFAMRSRRGPHAPIGHNAPKSLREEIDARLSKVQEIRFEPRLLSEEDDRLKQGSQISCYNYLYRMKALDAIRDSGIPLQEISRCPSAFTGRSFRNWLSELRNSHSLIKSSRSALIDRLLEGYDSARHGTGGESLFQYHQPRPASPVCSQGPDRLSCEEHSLHHPGHLPALHRPTQQEAQTFSGAQKFQRQLQHTGEHPVRDHG